MTLYTLDLLYSDRIVTNAITTNSLVGLNQWLAHYVNEGALPQIRTVDKPEPRAVKEL